MLRSVGENLGPMPPLDLLGISEPIDNFATRPRRRECGLPHPARAGAERISAIRSVDMGLASPSVQEILRHLRHVGNGLWV